MHKVAAAAIEILQGRDDDENHHQELASELKLLIEQARASGHLSAADDAWRLKAAIEIRLAFIRAFGLVKAGSHYDAWCALERCEIDSIFLVKNSSEEFQEMARLSKISHYVKMWQSLFPYNVFFSPGMLIGYHTCSVCGHRIRPSKSCDHRKGKIYGGELCVHIAHDIEIIEVSWVDNPVQKYSIPHLDYDYSVVDYVADRLETVFDGWQTTRTTRRFPRSAFASLRLDARCPCRTSEMQFGDCCAEKASIEIPHIDVVFSKPLAKELQTGLFPY